MTPRPVWAEDLRIHLVGAQDWASHRDLRLEMLATAPEAFWGRLDEVRRLTPAQWQAAVTGPVRYLQARDTSGTAHGTLGLQPHAERDMHLVSMYVRPAARGAGVADFLLEASAILTREMGRDRQLLEVARGSTAAIRLYQRHGFTSQEPVDAADTRPLTLVRRLNLLVP